jgi:hypothetical protein
MILDHNSNPPAFPSAFPDEQYDVTYYAKGMTILDHFAGQALPAIVKRNGTTPYALANNISGQNDQIAAAAYAVGFAMLHRRAFINEPIPDPDEAAEQNRQRDNAIRTIEVLYPADSEFSATRATGRSLLQEAAEKTGHTWRDLPDAVLLEYARLCEALHSRS